jgi:hypothetical protein
MIGNAAQHIGEPGLGIDAVGFCRGDQGVNRGSAVGAGEQPGAASERNRPVILPISGRRSRSIIAGMHTMGAAFAANMSSGAPVAMSFTSR